MCYFSCVCFTSKLATSKLLLNPGIVLKRYCWWRALFHSGLNLNYLFCTAAMPERGGSASLVYTSVMEKEKWLWTSPRKQKSVSYFENSLGDPQCSPGGMNARVTPGFRDKSHKLKRMVFRSDFMKGINMCKEKTSALGRKEGQPGKPKGERWHWVHVRKQPSSLVSSMEVQGAKAQILWFWSHLQAHPYSNIGSLTVKPSVWAPVPLHMGPRAEP